MIDPDLKAELDGLRAKIDATYESAEKTRTYLLWTLIITIAVIVLPLLVLPFVIGSLFSSYSTALGI